MIKIERVHWTVGKYSGNYIMINNRFSLMKGEWKGLMCSLNNCEDKISFFFLKNVYSIIKTKKGLERQYRNNDKIDLLFSR